MDNVQFLNMNNAKHLGLVCDDRFEYGEDLISYNANPIYCIQRAIFADSGWNLFIPQYRRGNVAYKKYSESDICIADAFKDLLDIVDSIENFESLSELTPNEDNINKTIETRQ